MGRKPGRAWISAGGQFMSRGARATIQNQAISELQLLPSPRLYPGFRLQHGRGPESRGHEEPLSQKPRLLQPEEAESTAPTSSCRPGKQAGRARVLVTQHVDDGAGHRIQAC